MGTSPGVPWWAQALPLVVVIAILAIRFFRPQRISVTRMWVGPIVLIALTVWSIYATERMQPAPAWEVAAALVIGGALGLPFGVLRGMHTDVRPTDKRGVMYLGSSWVTIVIFLAAFGLRYGVRMIMPHRGSLSTSIGDALLAFAIAFIASSYYFIYRKYEAELAARATAQPSS